MLVDQTHNHTESVEKISVEELIQDFKILNVDNFSTYIKDIWKVRINIK